MYRSVLSVSICSTSVTILKNRNTDGADITDAADGFLCIDPYQSAQSA
jgi:hypothetical protein